MAVKVNNSKVIGQILTRQGLVSLISMPLISVHFTTGSLDADTIKMMNARRCANRDVEQLTNALGLYRSKRFATAGAWDKRALTWSVREFPPRDSATTLTDAQILQVVREAFRVRPQSLHH